MAVSKVKRSIHLTQPAPQQAKTRLAGGSESQPQRPRLNPEQILRPKYGLRISPVGSQPRQTRPHARKAAQPAEQMPVRAHVYRTIAEMNDGFEHAVEGLQTLIKINYLRSDSLTGIQNLISRVRADANRELITVIHEREAANAGHFGRLCSELDGDPQR